MAGKIINFIITLGCAILMYSIGVYAQKKEDPMWFYSGVEVKPSEITNIAQYNKENAKMWKQYSMWFFISTIFALFNSMVSSILLVLGCIPGCFLLIWKYTKIYEKYRSK